MQNAEITLEVNGPVYKVITPVKTAQQFTDNSGGLIFTYISHELGVKYTITVRKGTSFSSVSLGTPSLTCA